MTYSQGTDIKLGSIPTPAYIDLDKLAQDAADEIDSYIGFFYETPVDVTDNGMLARPARLLLKRISVALSTGRLVLEVASSAEDVNLHAYGVRLVSEAHEALEQIRDGKILLDGADKLADTGEPTGPLLYNEDDTSQVEAFYELFKPTYLPYSTVWP